MTPGTIIPNKFNILSILIPYIRQNVCLSTFSRFSRVCYKTILDIFSTLSRIFFLDIVKIYFDFVRTSKVFLDFRIIIYIWKFFTPLASEWIEFWVVCVFFQEIYNNKNCGWVLIYSKVNIVFISKEHWKSSHIEGAWF